MPGAALIRLPLPFELNHVNVGLVRLSAGYLLIDTGMDTEESFEALSAALDARGVGWRDIRRILVTHMHPDHIGTLARLRELSGAAVLMHRAEADHLNEMVDAGRPPWIDEGFRLAGTPHSLSVAIHHSLKSLRDTLRRVTPDVALEGGELLGTAPGTAEVLWTPGHTVGHVCLYWPSQRLLYSGDHLIEKITPNIGWLPSRDCLGDYRRSLERLVPYAIDTVLPSHGTPFSGHVQWIRNTIAHHDERCGQIVRALVAAPRTAHHLVPALWDRHLSPFHYYFALFEVLAHLEYMFQAGVLQQSSASEGAILWSASCSCVPPPA